MGFMGSTELLIILAIVVILFGAKKIPELARGLGSGLKEFKDASSDVRKEITEATNDAKDVSDKESPS
jgi:sec-independent protein translocase protein TatA